jgi:hypothetical protein
MDSHLAVHFYSLKTGAYCGEGFLMPNMDFFETVYVPKHFPEAIKVDTNKYKIDDGRYICCEPSFMA